MERIDLTEGVRQSRQQIVFNLIEKVYDDGWIENHFSKVIHDLNHEFVILSLYRVMNGCVELRTITGVTNYGLDFQECDSRRKPVTSYGSTTTKIMVECEDSK